jgi:hypothetical protein
MLLGLMFLRISIRKFCLMGRMYEKRLIWNSFFKAPFYDTKVVEYAEANKQPFALMELITLSITNLTSPDYVGPVLVRPSIDSHAAQFQL